MERVIPHILDSSLFYSPLLNYVNITNDLNRGPLGNGADC